MTILQDVRFVNKSHSQGERYVTCCWVLLPVWKIAIRLTKKETFDGDEWVSCVLESPGEETPQDVQDWFLNNKKE